MGKIKNTGSWVARRIRCFFADRGLHRQGVPTLAEFYAGQPRS